MYRYILLSILQILSFLSIGQDCTKPCNAIFKHIDENYGKLSLSEYQMFSDSIVQLSNDCPSCNNQLFESWEYAVYQFRYQKNFIHQKEALVQLKNAFDKLELKDSTTLFYKYLIYNIRLAHYYDNVNDLVQGGKIYNHIIDTISYAKYFNKKIHEIKNLSLQSLSSIEQKRGNTHKAISYLHYCIEDELEMAEKKGRKAIVWSIYAKLGVLYNNVNDEKLAEYNFKKTNDHIETYLDTVSDKRLKMYAGQFYNRIISYAEFCLEHNNFEGVNKQIQILDNLPIADNNPRKTRLYLLKSSYYAQLSKVDSSDYFLAKADKNLINHPSETVQRAKWFLTKAKLNFNNTKRLYVNNDINEGLAYIEKYKNNDYLSEVYWDLKHLQLKELESLNKKEELLNEIRNIQKDISNKLATDLMFKDHITSVYNFYPILEKGLSLIYNAPEKDYDLAYDIIENIKSINLYKKFNASSLYHSVNDSLISKYKLQNALFTQLKHKRTIGDSTIALANEIFEKKQLVEKLVLKMKQKVTSSHLSRVDINLEAYKTTLKKGSSHILVFAGSEYYYFLSITRDKTKIERYKSNIIDDLSIQVMEKISSLTYQQSDNKSAETLYDMMSQVYPEDIKNLIISNDGNLNRVPFESLINKMGQYLVESINVHYVPSAKLRYILQSEPTKQAPSTLVIAPSNNNDNINLLKYAMEESHAIQKISNGVLFEKEQASLENFKKECEGFDILHLATHAVANNNDPEQSYIQFSSYQDSISSKLYFDEINNLILNSQMVCLSACQTATGNINLAEGMRSLSNEFIAAGSKSVVSTLWSIPDQTTSKIMQDFYTKLYDGHNKTTALSMAKRKYLKNAIEEERNPYYWAGIILMGSDQAIVRNTYTFNFYYLFIGLLIIVGLVWKYKN